MFCAPTHSNLAQIEKLAIKYDRKMAIHNTARKTDSTRRRAMS